MNNRFIGLFEKFKSIKTADDLSALDNSTRELIDSVRAVEWMCFLFDGPPSPIENKDAYDWMIKRINDEECRRDYYPV